MGHIASPEKESSKKSPLDPFFIHNARIKPLVLTVLREGKELNFYLS